jgi:hypothetical protein
MATAQQIQEIYQKELGRNLDPQGLAFYLNLANQGTPLQEIARQISASPEGMTYDPQGLLQYMEGQSSNFAAENQSPYVSAAQATAEANLKNAQAATAANRVNQVTPFGGLQYQQTGTDAQGNPIWTATQTMSPELQNIYGNLAQTAQGTYGQGFNPTLPSYGINPGETYSDAILRRLQPTQERQAKSLETQLANQGIMPNSEAYNTAKTQLSQAQNDQLTSAIVGGMSTGLAANQQAYNQALSNYQLPLNTLGAVKNLTNPNTSYVNPYNQAATTGPDYLTAYNQQQQNQLAANAAAQSGQNAMTRGLFGLGSSLLGSKTGGSLIEKGIGAIGGLLGGLF